MGRAKSMFFALSVAACLGVASGIAAAQEPDFGTPPSGEYPILFNDHHVYAKPDVDKQNRVLAALVRGKTVLVPLRSMFEQMGATVEYDPATRTAIVSKPGSEVRVTVGKPEVVINGESRPLDVPPEIYHGAVLVPLRVLSEGLGAYVQWVPEKRAVVVRYVPAPAPTPPPPPPATPTPAPPPPPPPVPIASPAPIVTPYLEKYVVVDAVAPRIYNEFDPNGQPSGPGINARGAIEVPVSGMHLMFEGDLTKWSWAHPTGPVNGFGATPAVVQPAFNANDVDFDLNFGMRIMQPRIYFIEGYMQTWNSYNYPHMHGIGYGLEKLPDLDHTMSLYGRWWYSSSIKGNFSSMQVGPTLYPAGSVAYIASEWLVGGTWNFAGPQSPVYLDFGYQGQNWVSKVNAPGDRIEYGPFVGLGAHF